MTGEARPEEEEELGEESDRETGGMARASEREQEESEEGEERPGI